MKKLVVLSLLATLVAALTGCDTATSMAPGNTTLQGATAGGLGGAAIGALASDDHGKGALIGAADVHARLLPHGLKPFQFPEL